MILLECIQKYDGGDNHCSGSINLGDIVALMNVERLDYNKASSFVHVQVRKSDEWPEGLQQGERLERFRFIPKSQHARALKFGDIPITIDGVTT